MGVVTRRPAAEDDLVDIWVYIAREDLAAAERVLSAIEETVKLLSDTPDMGICHVTRIKRLAGIRFFPAKRFRSFLIYYQPVPGGIEIVRVIRGERDRARLLEESG